LKTVFLALVFLPGKMSFVETVEPLYTVAHDSHSGGASEQGGELGGVYVEESGSIFESAFFLLRAVHWYCVTGMWVAAAGLLCNVLALAHARYKRDSLHTSAPSPPAPADKRSLRKKLT